MKVFVHGIETAVPPYVYRQDYACDCMMRWLPGKRSRRLIRGIYDHSGIETRYSVLPDFAPGAEPVLFRENTDGVMVEPATGARNDHYAAWARKLPVEVCRKVLQRDDGFAPADVTHVITVSCTGFSNPGMDLHIVQGLGLPANVERYHLGFMGCYAAFPALRMARQFCQARPDAVVLVCCLELCTLHLQLREEPDSLLANALFADGAAAAVVSARAPAAGQPAFALHSFASFLAPEGAGDMAWTIGDRGFNIRLSAYVPEIIAANIGAITTGVFAASPWQRDAIRLWAIHPGGRAILDKVEQGLDLAPEQVADARAVLREFGNMSSATILFVLKRILEHSGGGVARPVCALAFGPGLTIESALLEHLPGVRAGTVRETPRHASRAHG